MVSEDFSVFAKYYDKIYRNKNYKLEAETIKQIIRLYEKRKTKTLLDIGCGTGEHLQHLRSHFECTGLDSNKIMIAKAGKKFADINFKIANMINFSFDTAFDVIICLFSTICYVETFPNLILTLQNFNKHLNMEGLVIIEQMTTEQFKKQNITLKTFQDEETVIARMAASKILDSKWLISMDYLVGEKGKIKHFYELHKILALDQAGYIEALKTAHFRNIHATPALWHNGKTLFIARKEKNVS